MRARTRLSSCTAELTKPQTVIAAKQARRAGRSLVCPHGFTDASAGCWEIDHSVNSPYRVGLALVALCSNCS